MGGANRRAEAEKIAKGINLIMYCPRRPEGLFGPVLILSSALRLAACLITCRTRRPLL